MPNCTMKPMPKNFRLIKGELFTLFGGKDAKEFRTNQIKEENKCI